MDQNPSVIFLGTRGSVPVSGAEFNRFGGATACVLVRMGGRTIVLDAGTGILRLEQYLKPEERAIDLLLSHPHLDHIEGLRLCSAFFRSELSIDFWAEPWGGRGPKEQVEAAMSVPLWPVGPAVFSAQVQWRTLPEGGITLGAVRVDTAHGVHPGGSTLFRLRAGEADLVYATDFEYGPDSAGLLCAFARDCGLLIIDGQYADGERNVRRGFGHTTWGDAVQAGREAGARRIAIFHHDPRYTDADLERVQQTLQAMEPKAFFARAGEELSL